MIYTYTYIIIYMFHMYYILYISYICVCEEVKRQLHSTLSLMYTLYTAGHSCEPKLTPYILYSMQ